ncbi:hypothetical protein CVT26_013948 [Gymnopilus dilepis]|uniref:Uncharacterized protein n=1 Tax=Gymnopilus dilepis TaxID=231916 RepID=A0A409WDR8_9AGAR|nr:hypothetical protein CVT26_013948 [Gymnopilus dilepis]
MHDIRQLFKIKVNTHQTISEKPEVVSVSDVRDNWNPTQYGRLCSLLTVYRLLDTLAFVTGVSQRAACLNRSVENSLLSSLPLTHHNHDQQGSECLLDWTSTVLRLQDLVQEPSVINHPAAARDSVSRRLMAFLRLNAKSAVQCRVMLNLTIAAMHIAYLKEARFPQNSLPDLPDRITTDMVECAANPEEKDFLVDLQDVLRSISGCRQRVAGGDLSLASFRGPLQVALALSPVYMLSTKLLGNKVWNKRVLTDVSNSLGNNKPSTLLDVEKIIWNVLFLLADGQLDPREVLIRLNHDMPWADVERSSKLSSSRSWFHQTFSDVLRESSDHPSLPLMASVNTSLLSAEESFTLNKSTLLEGRDAVNNPIPVRENYALPSEVRT